MDKKQNRNFRISCGLREGYEISSTEHSVDEARELIGMWIENRLNAGKKIVTGTLLSGEFIYPIEEAGSFNHSTEPAVNFVGQLREDATEEDASEMLTNLAQLLASTFKQKRVHVEYSTEYWIIET